MKIAVPSVDGKTISEHFGRSTCFIIFTMDENGNVLDKEVRENGETAHALGECTGHEQGHQHGHEHHSHAAVVNRLGDCAVILCRGIGWRAVEDFKSKGVEAFILDAPFAPDEAASLYARGKLVAGGQSCRCHG